MADGTLDQILGWLKGTPSAPPNLQLGLEKAPALTEYPTQADADNARNYGFADNNIHEDYLNNNKARVLGTDFPLITKKGKFNLFLPASGKGVQSQTLFAPDNSKDLNLNDKLNSDIQGNLRNTMMTAALAANRSPIAAVGFDPSRTVMDIAEKKPNPLGLYDPNSNRDAMYSAMMPNDAIVHESTHRGMQKLAEIYPDAQNIMDRMTEFDKEMAVRWLMHKEGGDPEGKIPWANEDVRQRQQAINHYNPKIFPYSAPKNQADLDALEELAIQHMKGRGKRAGPQ